MRAAPALFFLVAAGCSGVRPHPQGRAEPPLTEPSGAAFVTPARWDYHPPAPTTALAAVKLPDGGCAFTAEGGQRWSATATKQTGNRVVCSGRADASFAVAPEDLTSAIRRADGSWIYVGESGALYEAGEPLGAFTRTVPAPEPLAKVTGAGTAVLAATQEGRLLRWEAAKGWRAASPSPALAGARIFDLAVGEGAERGRVLALGFPEALFASTDDGVTWTAAAAPTAGARRLGHTAAGDLGAQGIFESVVWRGASFVRAPDKIVVPQATLDVEVGRAPSAAAVQAARAVLDGDRYYEVVRPENEGEAWLLARGRIEGRLETVTVPESERCSNLRLGARGKVVFVACVLMDGSEIAAELRRSTDAATTWSEPLRLITPDTDQITIAVSPDGGAMVTGVCRSSDASGACKPTAPVRLREALATDPAPGADAHGPPALDGGSAPGAPALDGGSASRAASLPGASHAGAGDAGAGDAGAGPRAQSLRALPSSAPQLSGNALDPAFGADGRSAYFLGRRGKDDRISLFVSHDGGETFSPRTLQSSGTTRPARRPDDEEPSEGEGPETFEIDETSSLRPGDDATIGLMVLRSRGGYAYVTADDDGRVLQVAGPPLDEEGNLIDVLLAGYGRRVLAVPSYASEGSSGILWESLDGGANWDKQTMPQALVREYSRGAIAVTCALAGCVIGDTVARVGWGGAADAGALDRPAEPSAGGAQTVLAPIVCDLSPSTRWSRVDDVYMPTSNGTPLPTARDVMRGRSVWSALSLDRATGALTATTAALPESGEGEARVIKRSMLGARSPHTALEVSATQLEGYAAVRAPYPVSSTGAPQVGAPMRNVEVAWENFLEGTSGRARIPDAGPIERGDVTVNAGGIDVLHASMISVTSRGLFVRPHLSHGRAAEEIFVDPAGRLERYPSTPWPSTGALGALDFRADAAAMGGELLGVGLLQDGDGAWSAAVLAKRAPGGGWTYLADALLPQRAPSGPLAVLTTWGWSAKAPVGVTALVADPQHARAWAHFVGFRSDGTFSPAQPVPTLYDLGERPRPCTLADRTGTARAVMLFKAGSRGILFPGARHPVLVHEPRPKNAVGVAEPLVLITSSAVLHGTPASPCLAAFQADSATSAPLGAVIPGDLARSWLFRHSVDAPRAAGKRTDTAATPTLEYRPMTCRYDPGARIPEVVWSQEGTARP